jgi:hypothetical protein
VSLWAAERRAVEVGANMAVGPATREFVLTRPAVGNEHWLSLWVVGLGDGETAYWRQVTGPRFVYSAPLRVRRGVPV